MQVPLERGRGDHEEDQGVALLTRPPRGIVANEAPQKLMEERGQKTTVRPVGEHDQEDLIEARGCARLTKPQQGKRDRSVGEEAPKRPVAPVGEHSQ